MTQKLRRSGYILAWKTGGRQGIITSTFPFIFHGNDFSNCNCEQVLPHLASANVIHILLQRVKNASLPVYSTYPYYYDYNENLPVVMSDVNCEGNESRLIDCSYSTGGSGSTVSLRCSYDSEFSLCTINTLINKAGCI